jgi:hypothetical protein
VDTVREAQSGEPLGPFYVPQNDRFEAEDGGHVANNRGYPWRLQSADWIPERLAAE